MTDNELLTLAEREAQRLTDENDHGAAIIMRALMDRVRVRPDMPGRVVFNTTSQSMTI